MNSYPILYTRVGLVSYGYAIMAFISNMYDDDILAWRGVCSPYMPIHSLAMGTYGLSYGDIWA